jgi:hypothetical protein
MSVSTEQQIREHALRKGMDLIRLTASDTAGLGDDLYQLTVMGESLRIYPQGIGNHGAPLCEIENWLSWPWE